MNIKQALVELKQLSERWGLEINDWMLFLHWCDILQGYDLQYGRDNHLHIMVVEDKIPWHFDRSQVNTEITIPPKSGYGRDFAQFIKKTGWDFHLLVAGKSLFNTLLEKESILYKVKGGNIRMATTLGNLHYWKTTIPSWINKYSVEVIARRFLWIEQIYLAAKQKGDYKVAQLAGQLIRKYRPKDKKVTGGTSKAIKLYELRGEILGEIGFPGKVTGRVFLVERPDNPPAEQKGKILVTKLASPKLTPHIKVAKAVVTDEGGKLSHAATLCRELNIPCIVGAKIATKVFKDGDSVSIDGDKGIVKKIG